MKLELTHRSTSTTHPTMESPFGTKMENDQQEMPLLPYLDSSVHSLARVTSVRATYVYLPSDQRHWSQVTLVLGSDMDHDPIATKPVHTVRLN